MRFTGTCAKGSTFLPEDKLANLLTNLGYVIEREQAFPFDQITIKSNAGIILNTVDMDFSFIDELKSFLKAPEKRTEFFTGLVKDTPACDFASMFFKT